jgi:hypothetical protein
MDDKGNLITELVKALDLDELTEGYRRRLLILDSQIEALRQLENDLRDILVKFRTACILIDVPSNSDQENTGEDEWQNENSSSRCRTLDVFAKNTS